MEEFNRICALYPLNDIYAKMENDVIQQSDEAILNLIDLLKVKYIESLEYQIQYNIEKYMYVNYLEKRDVFLRSSLFKEPYALLLLIILRSNINNKRKDSLAIEQIDKVISKIFKESSLENILKTNSQNRYHIILDYFVQIEDDEALRRKKFTEYITSISRFKEIVNYFLDGIIDDVIFYQKLLGNIENETIEKYISELEQDGEITEFEAGKKIKNGMKQAIPYIIYELSDALENSEKQNIKCEMNANFKKQKQLFLGLGIASEEQQKSIQNILEKVEQHNKRF